MIITKIPFRLPVGGGGTDLPSYYYKHGGQLITASINRYMYVSINEPVTSDQIKLYYAYTEKVNDIKDIKHNIIRETLKFYGINWPIEIGSMADIDAGTGMGSSSAFTVGLVSGLNELVKEHLSPLEIADRACHIEMDLVGKSVGKQDQYATALGGINDLTINNDGQVFVERLNLNQDILYELESRLLMFYTNTQREANDILSEQSKNMADIEQVMHSIKDIGRAIKKALLTGNIDLFGRLLNLHWMDKKLISPRMSNNNIDQWYNIAIQNGAIGGKIMGAGGGGLFLFCCREGQRKKLKDIMLKTGLKYMDFRFEFDGVKVLL